MHLQIDKVYRHQTNTELGPKITVQWRLEAILFTTRRS